MSQTLGFVHVELGPQTQPQTASLQTIGLKQVIRTQAQLQVVVFQTWGLGHARVVPHPQLQVFESHT